jgi:hypothetical protein
VSVLSADEVLAQLTDDRLLHVTVRAGRIAMWATVATVACLAAGIWLDWRWFPTAAITGIVACCEFWFTAAGHQERIRRRRAS